MHATYSHSVWLLSEEAERGAERRILVNETNSFSGKASLGLLFGTLRSSVSVSILWSDGYN